MSDWANMSLTEKVEQLHREMMHKDNQISSLQLTVNEIGDAVKSLEQKLKNQK